MYLIRESADVSGELRVRGKLTDMVHKKLHHFEMTLNTLEQTHNETYMYIHVCINTAEKSFQSEFL